MATRDNAVYAIYPNNQAAEDAVAALRRADFRNDDISVLFSSPETSKEFAHEQHTRAPEGAAAGGGTGALLGGTLGWLAGIGAIAIPGVGPFIAAGPIMGLLAGMGVGGALGSVTGALIGLGIPEFEAERYEGRLTEGGVLLSIHSDNHERTKKAQEILEATGAQEITVKTEEAVP